MNLMNLMKKHNYTQPINPTGVLGKTIYSKPIAGESFTEKKVHTKLNSQKIVAPFASFDAFL